MKKYGMIILVCFLLFGILCSVSAGGKKETSGKQMINFYSGSPGGGWYPIALAISDVWNSNISNLEFSHADAGGSGNLVAIESGKANVAVSTSASIGDGIVGNDPFNKPTTKVMGLAAFTPEPWTIFVWQDSGINTLQDLKGKRIVPLPRGYTTEVITRRVLSAIGLSYDDFAKVDFVHISEAVSLMKDNHTDAFADTFAEEGDPTIIELSLMRPLRALEIPSDVQKKVSALSPGLTPYVVKGGNYKGIDKDINVLGQSLSLAISADLSEDLVYQMTKSMVENWDKITLSIDSFASVKPEDLASDVLGAPFHPGAAKYYREKGWLK